MARHAVTYALDDRTWSDFEDSAHYSDAVSCDFLPIWVDFGMKFDFFLGRIGREGHRHQRPGTYRADGRFTQRMPRQQIGRSEGRRRRRFCEFYKILPTTRRRFD